MITDSRTTFNDDELLVSRTDKRGVILAANRAFQKISGFEKSELQNAPHKIVRHDDMPKGAFWLVWSKLEKGEPVCTFVKNKTKSDGHYWVFASMTPLDDGYMSMRIKPSASSIEIVDKLYKEVLEDEIKRELTPEESAKNLVHKLALLGYPSFESFMATFAASEIVNRKTDKATISSDRDKKKRDVLDKWSQVKEECQKVSDAYERLSTTSSNLQIQAAALNEKGRGMHEISKNFAVLAKQINTELANLSDGATDVEKTVEEVLVLDAVSSLLIETETMFREEQRDGEDNEQEFKLMNRQRKIYTEQVHQAMINVGRKLDSFFLRSEEIKRSLIGLSVTRTMCAIENASISQQSDSSIPAIIEELSRFQGIADGGISVIEGRMKDVREVI